MNTFCWFLLFIGISAMVVEILHTKARNKP